MLTSRKIYCLSAVLLVSACVAVAVGHGGHGGGQGGYTKVSWVRRIQESGGSAGTASGSHQGGEPGPEMSGSAEHPLQEMTKTGALLQCPHPSFIFKHNSLGQGLLSALYHTMRNRFQEMVSFILPRNSVLMGEYVYRVTESGECENVAQGPVFDVEYIRAHVSAYWHAFLYGTRCRLQHDRETGHLLGSICAVPLIDPALAVF